MKGETPIKDFCIHGEDRCDATSKYPAFHIGLEKPFVILLSLCEVCQKNATVDTVLTDRRWVRMLEILCNNGEKLPRREDVTMTLHPIIYRPGRSSDARKAFEESARNYSYVLTC